MSCTRAMIFEMPQLILWTAGIKKIQATTLPLLRRFKKNSVLN